jgi:hypothetical protein
MVLRRAQAGLSFDELQFQYLSAYRRRFRALPDWKGQRDLIRALRGGRGRGGMLSTKPIR